VNVVLAQAGAVVASALLAMPPLQVSCCMRVEDSLAQGVSFFMAELRRLKAVIDRVQAPDGRTPLYLLDEILQGTNTAERQIASRRVLEQLTTLSALGAVSSHDLELITGTALQQVAIPVHFAEQFHRDEDGPQMTFDYRLRPGLATSSNAIRLMEMIGFDIHE
jgi:DNA mismatch repair ATPase MutS